MASKGRQPICSIEVTMERCQMSHCPQGSPVVTHPRLLCDCSVYFARSKTQYRRLIGFASSRGESVRGQCEVGVSAGVWWTASYGRRGAMSSEEVCGVRRRRSIKRLLRSLTADKLQSGKLLVVTTQAVHSDQTLSDETHTVLPVDHYVI
ncbi:unnamed protein product, partial [Iphiclides podalirius]